MEDALLFQAQAEETCALWQAGGVVPEVPRVPAWGWQAGGAYSRVVPLCCVFRGVPVPDSVCV